MTETMNEMLLEYGKLKEQVKYATARIKELDEDVRAFVMEEQQVSGDAYMVQGFSFKCELMPGRVTFDKTKLAAAHPEINLEDYNKVGKPFTKLTVTF